MERSGFKPHLLQLSKHLWLVDVAIRIVTSSIISTNTTSTCSSTRERANKIAVECQDVTLGSSSLIGLSTAIEVALLGLGRCNSWCSHSKKGLFAYNRRTVHGFKLFELIGGELLGGQRKTKRKVPRAL